MRRVIFAGLALVGACASSQTQAANATAHSGEVISCAHAEPDGGRTVCHEIVIAAPRDEVWRLLSTSEGLRTWAAPVVALDLRLGGIWEASYNPDAALGDPANIRNRVLSFAPGRMLSLQVDRAPPAFPHADLARDTWSVIELQDAGAGRTRVRVSGIGYRTGPGHDELYAFFDRGNAWTLQQLQRRVVDGPADWRETVAPQPASP